MRDGKCWQDVKFLDVKGLGKHCKGRNEGIDARTTNKIKQKRMGELSILMKKDGMLCFYI